MIATEFLLVFSVTVGATSCEATASPDVADFCATTGGERQSYAFVLLGLFTVAMAWGAAIGRSRPAGAALVLVGAVVVAIALLGTCRMPAPRASSGCVTRPRSRHRDWDWSLPAGRWRSWRGCCGSGGQLKARTCLDMKARLGRRVDYVVSVVLALQDIRSVAPSYECSA